MSIETIMEFNCIILDRLVLEPGMESGQIRTKDIEIPTHRFKVASAEDCHYLLEQLCTWLNSKTFDAPSGMSIVYGILKAIIANLYLTWISPFIKGNARNTHLVEFMLLFESGLPAITAVHFSRFYNHTKYDYWAIRLRPVHTIYCMELY